MKEMMQKCIEASRRGKSPDVTQGKKKTAPKRRHIDFT